MQTALANQVETEFYVGLYKDYGSRNLGCSGLGVQGLEFGV